MADRRAAGLVQVQEVGQAPVDALLRALHGLGDERAPVGDRAAFLNWLWSRLLLFVLLFFSLFKRRLARRERRFSLR